MTTAEKKLVKHRLSVLELAQALGDVSEGLGEFEDAEAVLESFFFPVVM